MRLFVAITPPPDALAELEALTAPLRPEWPGLRWTSQDAWHLTLAFLGEVSEGVLAELRKRLERAAHRHPSLQLSISGAGTFPAARRAQVLWAGIAGDQRALAALAASVAAGARRAGAPPPGEHKRYRAHVTLARCPRPSDLRVLVPALASFTGSAWTAAQIHLIRSNSGGQPRYTGEGCWPLRGGEATATAGR